MNWNLVRWWAVTKSIFDWLSWLETYQRLFLDIYWCFFKMTGNFMIYYTYLYWLLRQLVHFRVKHILHWENSPQKTNLEKLYRNTRIRCMPFILNISIRERLRWRFSRTSLTLTPSLFQSVVVCVCSTSSLICHTFSTIDFSITECRVQFINVNILLLFDVFISLCWRKGFSQLASLLHLNTTARLLLRTSRMCCFWSRSGGLLSGVSRVAKGLKPGVRGLPFAFRLVYEIDVVNVHNCKYSHKWDVRRE
jgi:hypothetical protein